MHCGYIRLLVSAYNWVYRESAVLGVGQREMAKRCHALAPVGLGWATCTLIRPCAYAFQCAVFPLSSKMKLK